jgi:hypothetical protein
MTTTPAKNKMLELTRQAESGSDLRAMDVLADWRPCAAIGALRLRTSFWFLVLFAIAIEMLTTTAPVNYLEQRAACLRR